MADSAVQSIPSTVHEDHLPRPLLRILCLHDSNSHAAELKERLALLGDRLYLQHGIDLVYANSPLTVLSDDAVEHPTLLPKRVWWHSDDDGNDNKLTGLDASLLLLQQVWNSTPFWGILGMGQGAAVTSVFMLMNTTHPPPQLAIFLAGQSLLPESELLLVPDSIPCFHMVHPSNIEELKLVQQFGGKVHEREATSKILTKSDLNAIGSFVVQQKRRLAEGGAEIVALQSALHYAELEAADTIAEQIAANPPAALMAIIRPQHVAGWNGNKRRQPGEEGGGAPCPPEFLLKREKRPTSVDNASREHPNQSANHETEEL